MYVKVGTIKLVRDVAADSVILGIQSSVFIVDICRGVYLAMDIFGFMRKLVFL